MFGYKDITFCSNKECRNVKCERHFKNVPWDKLPDYMWVTVTDFTRECKQCQMPKDEQTKEEGK